MNIILYTVLSYLLGAIPFGLLIAKTRGVDIRKEGSGNIGATNVFRCVGKGWGIFSFILDVLKGYIPAHFFAQFAGVNPEYGVLFGIAAILGHTFPVYLKFKGGKGVATSAGMLLGIAPIAVGVGFVCWVVCMFLTRYVSLSSMVASVAVAITIWVRGEDGLVVNVALTFLSVLVIWLHRSNIKRLMTGTENKMGKKKKDTL